MISVTDPVAKENERRAVFIKNLKRHKNVQNAHRTAAANTLIHIVDDGDDVAIKIEPKSDNEALDKHSSGLFSIYKMNQRY